MTVVTGETSRDEYLDWNKSYDTTEVGSDHTSSITWSNNSNSHWSATISAPNATDEAVKTATLKTLNFYFNGEPTSQVLVQSKDNSSVTIKGGTSATALKGDFKNLDIGTESNNIDMAINFGSQTGKTIDISNVKTLYGNIAISSSSKTGNSNKYTMQAEKIKGNLYEIFHF